jgi:hypothetical protein
LHLSILLLGLYASPKVCNRNRVFLVNQYWMNTSCGVIKAVNFSATSVLSAVKTPSSAEHDKERHARLPHYAA